MHIYISDELEYLRKDFIRKGYKIVNDPYKSDVILTNLKETNLSNINNKVRNSNIIIIDSVSRNMKDIENILINYYGNELY